MLTYNIKHATTYDECINIGVKLTSPTKYCFRNSLYKFNCDIYGNRINQNHFNANVYYIYYIRYDIDDIMELYNKSLTQYKNIKSYHYIQVLNNGLEQSHVVISTYMQKHYKCKYIYAFDVINSGVGWPPTIPEPYKLECKYVEYPEYYTPTEITNENISMHDNVLYLDNKPLGNNGHYLNECNMYIVDGDVCEIHLPFNIINAKFILDKYKHYKLKFINDNNQLEGHCKTCIIDHHNILQQLHILNDDLMICTSSIDTNKTFDELITFKQTI